MCCSNLLQNHSTETSFVISGHKTGWRWNSIHLISSNSFGIKRCKGLRKRKRTHQSEVVNLCSGPRVHSRLSDMLNRSTLLCSSPTSPLIVSAINLLPVILRERKKEEASFRLCWKLTIWFARTEKYHKRAVHLGPRARWCQDGRWPKARRTESSSERSAARCFPFLCLHDIFLPLGSLWELFDEAWVPSMEDLAWQSRWGMGDGGCWGELGPPACTFNCLKIYFPYSLPSHWGASLCHVED